MLYIGKFYGKNKLEVRIIMEILRCLYGCEESYVSMVSWNKAIKISIYVNKVIELNER